MACGAQGEDTADFADIVETPRRRDRALQVLPLRGARARPPPDGRAPCLQGRGQAVFRRPSGPNRRYRDRRNCLYCFVLLNTFQPPKAEPGTALAMLPAVHDVWKFIHPFQAEVPVRRQGLAVELELPQGG